MGVLPGAGHPQQLGPYRVVERLGQGGMGAVYAGFHPELGVTRAVKVMTRIADAKGRARFEREVRSLAAIRHRNVVAVHETGLDADRPWFSMDLLAGETLTAVIAARRLTLDRALELAIAAGVEALHRAGIVHRDLKPENVIVVGEGHPVIVDLGLAVAPDSDERLTKTGAALGTLNYMAPEQLLGQRTAQGTPTDVYALGLILHELLTGQSATPAHSSAAGAMVHILESRRVVPSDVDPDLPAALDALVARATAREPAARHADAGELRQALERVRAAPGPTRRLVRRRRALQVGAVAGPLVVLAGVALAWPRGGAPPAAQETTTPTSTTPPLATDRPRPRPAALDAAQVAIGQDELKEARRLPLEERLDALADWLRRWPSHPAAREAAAAWRADRRQVPLVKMARTPNLVAWLGPGHDRVLLLGFHKVGALWDLAADPPAMTTPWTIPTQPTQLAVSADGTRGLVGLVDGTLAVLSCADGALQPIEGCAGDDLDGVALSADGRRGLAAARHDGRGLVYVVDLEARKARRGARELQHPVSNVAMAPGEASAYSTSGIDLEKARDTIRNVLVEWDLTTGAVLREVELPAFAESLDVSPAGLLAMGFDTRTAGLFAPTLELKLHLDAPDVDDDLAGFGSTRAAHRGVVKAVAFMGERLLTASGNRGEERGNELRLWDPRTGEHLERLPLPGYTFVLAPSPDGRRLITISWDGQREGGIFLWDLDPPTPGQ